MTRNSLIFPDKVSTRRRAVLVGALTAIVGAGAVHKALANSLDKQILIVSDSKWTTQTLVDQMLRHAGGVQNLRELGYEISFLSIPVGDVAALTASIGQVAANPPSLLVIFGDDEVLAFHDAFPQIPMVFWCNTDPSSIGLVQSLRLPGGLLTGATSDWVENVKPLEFLAEVIGRGASNAVKRIGVFCNGYWFADARRAAWSTASVAFGFALEFVPVETYAELVGMNAWQTVQQFDAVILPVSTASVTDATNMVRHLRERRIISVFENFLPLTVGAPLGYEHNRIDVYAQLGQTLGLIVRGVAPSEIPVRGPEGWAYAVNKAALQDFGVVLSPNVAAQIARVF